MSGPDNREQVSGKRMLLRVMSAISVTPVLHKVRVWERRSVVNGPMLSRTYAEGAGQCPLGSYPCSSFW